MPTKSTTATADKDLQPALRLARNLVGNASCADADRVAVDIRYGEGGVEVIVEDDGTGMTSAQLDRFFDAPGGEDPFEGAEEVHVATTRNDTTLKAHSTDPPEYRSTELDGAEWEEGTRVETRGVPAPDDIIERLNSETVRDTLALGDDDGLAVVTIREKRP